MTGYAEYLERRAQLANSGGFEPTHMPDHLFDFQLFLVEFAVKQGRAAIFSDCGTGKAPMTLAWAQNVYERTGKPVLILTPLAVGFQFVAEGHRFGYDIAQSRNGKVAAPLTVTNYEQLAKFDHTDFCGVACDESSVLKSFSGVTKAMVTEFMRLLPYRLLATATAAPNDYTELGTSSEALGNLGYMDMLTRFFINKERSVSSRGRGQGGASLEWRLKGHAEEPFWRWVATWARAMRKPSDYGFDDGRFILPPLVENVHLIDPQSSRDGHIIDLPAVGLREEREETRRTLTERCEKAADLLSDTKAAVAWCHLNDESAALARMIEGAVELSGSDSVGAKEEKLLAFSHGDIRVLVTKPKLASFGLNWQHANQMTYFPSHSYEQYYQAVRRMWRFGQESQVTVDVVTTPGGENVLRNLHRKSAAADRMFTSLVAHMNEALAVVPHKYDQPMEMPSWL